MSEANGTASKVGRTAGSLDALVGHWMSEESKFRDSGHNSMLNYDTRARFRAYADVYERCRKELMECMANPASDVSRPAGDSTSTQDRAGRD